MWTGELSFHLLLLEAVGGDIQQYTGGEDVDAPAELHLEPCFALVGEEARVEGARARGGVVEVGELGAGARELREVAD